MSKNQLILFNQDGQRCTPSFSKIKERITNNGNRSLRKIHKDYTDYCIITENQDRIMSLSTLKNWFNGKTTPAKRTADTESQAEFFIEFLNAIYHLDVSLEDIMEPIISKEARSHEIILEESHNAHNYHLDVILEDISEPINNKEAECPETTNVDHLNTHNYHYKLYFGLGLFAGTYALMGLLGAMCFLVPIQMTNVPSKFFFAFAIPAFAIAFFAVVKIRHIPPEHIPKVKQSKKLPSAAKCYKRLLLIGITCVTGAFMLLILSPRLLVNGADFYDVYIVPSLFVLAMFTFFMLYLFSRDKSMFPENE